MALTEMQLNEIEYQTALTAATSHTVDRSEELNKQYKADVLRQAQAIVFENRRLLTAAEATDVTAATITAVADELLAYING